MSRPHPIERGIALVRELVLEDPAAALEFESSRADFFGPLDPRGGPGGVPLVMAERRHLEWFALERTSAALGDLPFEALLDTWRERADADERAAVECLRQSVTGVFEVRDVDPGRGLWLHDLLSLGAFPVAEAEASAALEEGDILAGRIFPLGDSQFRLSPAVAVFRNPALLDALRRDLEQVRRGRRGSLRIHQGEIERMFFHEQRVGSPSLASEFAAAEMDADPDADLGRLPDPDAPRELRQLLVDSGMDAELVDGTILQLAALALGGEGARAEGHALLGELLAQAAFETGADLKRLTELAHEAFASLAARAIEARATEARERETKQRTEGKTAAPRTGPSPAVDGGQKPARTERAEPSRRDKRETREGVASESGSESGADRPKIAEALAAFDAARAGGSDLDALFAQLESELGLDDVDEEDPGDAPDFPGVLGAIVQEFLWELGLVEGEGAALAHRGLMRLSAFGEQIGVFENFGPEHLLEFAARWSIDRGDLHGARQASSMLESLEKFCRWIEEQHHSPLWTLFERTHGELTVSLPRVAAVNESLRDGARAAAHGRSPSVVRAHADGVLGIYDESGAWLELVAPDSALASVREGDLVLWSPHKNGAELLLLYPPQAASLFDLR